MAGEKVVQLELVRSFKEQNEALDRELASLKSGGPGGTSGGMDSVDAKIAAAEARTDTKFAALRADLAQFATKGTVWTAIGTLGAILLAVAAFGGDRFDAGMSASSAMDAAMKEQRERDAAQDAKLDKILERLPQSPAANANTK